jgi:hypothetical protein
MPECFETVDVGQVGDLSVHDQVRVGSPDGSGDGAEPLGVAVNEHEVSFAVGELVGHLLTHTAGGTGEHSLRPAELEWRQRHGEGRSFRRRLPSND